MPALDNPKHELFARGVARGLTQVEAHQAAGFTYSPSNASALAKRPAIKARIEELMAEREATLAGVTDWGKVESATNREELGLDQYWVLKELMITVKLARESNQFSAAVKALEMLGKETGLSFAGPQQKLPSVSGESEKQPVNVNVLVDFADRLNALGANPESLIDASAAAIDITPLKRKYTKRAKETDRLNYEDSEEI